MVRVFQSGWGSILVVVNSSKSFVGARDSSVMVLSCLFFCFFFSGEEWSWGLFALSLDGGLAGGGFVMVELVLVGSWYVCTYGGLY